MLGPNPRKAGTPSSELPPKTAFTSQGDGLMVKAIDEIFRHVEEADKPELFKVITHFHFQFHSKHHFLFR